MPDASGEWSTYQLTEFLAHVSFSPDEASAARTAVERAAEVLEAEAGALVQGGVVVASVGFPLGAVPDLALLAVAQGTADSLDVPGLGKCEAATVGLEGPGGGWLLVARFADGGFSEAEQSLLRGMGRLLMLTLRMLGTLTAERALRATSERQAEEKAALLQAVRQRQRLLETLLPIQRAISHRAPLQAVLDAVTAGAHSLLGDEIVGLRLIDRDDPSRVVLVSGHGMNSDLLLAASGTIGSGAGGKAISHQGLVIVEAYEHEPSALPEFVAAGVRTAMAAPVHENGAVIGSLTIATRVQGRVYGTNEQETLLAFAEHVSLALNDAKTADDLQHQAFHDTLTGLPNRALFMDRLQRALARGARRRSQVAVLFIDIDRFKTVNDSLGHTAGDEVLRAAARRLSGCLRDEDTAARLGGDEFAILLEDLREPRKAALVAARVLVSMRAPFQFGGKTVLVGASVGVAVSTPGTSAASDLLRNADLAMYRSKGAGGDRQTNFEPGMHLAVMERIELETDLRRAVEANEFVLRYQPVLELATGRLVGVEALVRWAHPTRGLIPPCAFIPLAEETGLILPIGQMVLRAACEQAVRWQERFSHQGLFSMNVNLSALQLANPAVVDDVARVLAETGLPAACLVLEITETMLVHDEEDTIRRMAQLKGLGVRIAIDDFGTGYSSLSYLRRLPVDILKIDKSFVDGVARDPSDRALAEMIVRLAETLGLQTVAEGIEEPSQLDRLKDLRCQLGQGNLFACPLPAADIETWLSVRPGPALPATPLEPSRASV